MKDWALIGKLATGQHAGGRHLQHPVGGHGELETSMWRCTTCLAAPIPWTARRCGLEPHHWRVGKIPTTPTGLVPASFANWSNLLGFDIRDNSLTQET